jgi:hypothetical protein
LRRVFGGDGDGGGGERGWVAVESCRDGELGVELGDVR